jgi:hypothetical protein
MDRCCSRHDNPLRDITATPDARMNVASLAMHLIMT